MRKPTMAVSIATVLMAAAACSGGYKKKPSYVTGGHSTIVVASGSMGVPSGGGGSGYSVEPEASTYYFNPTPDTVASGVAVTFQFQDVGHTVTFDQAPGEVHNIPTTTNADSTRTFDVAGTYTYHCSNHPYMHGMVVVQ